MAGRHLDAASLALLAGGDIDRLGWLRARWHIRGCGRCSYGLQAFTRLREDLHTAAGDMPPGINWNALAEEMTGNIRVGLAAGECVSDFRPHRRLPRLHWNGAVAAALITCLFIAGFWMNLPRQQTDHLLTALGRFAGRNQGAGVVPPATGHAAPEADNSVLVASPEGIEWKGNGSSVSFKPADAEEMTLTVSTQGSVDARVVNSDTGQETITRVYDAR